MTKNFYTDPMDVLAGTPQHNTAKKQTNGQQGQQEWKRQKKSIHIYTTQDLFERASEAAALSDRSLSQWIIDAMRAHLEK